MTEHRLLTGASLHEPKGVETATANQVYVSDGLGSGSWQPRYGDIINRNSLFITDFIDDVSTANSSFWAVMPTKASLTRVQTVLSGPITTANNVLTIYKNGIAQTPTITIPFTGSGAGVTSSTTITPAITFLSGDTLELRSNGASDTAAVLSVSLSLTAVV